jgi:protein TonB
MDREQNPHGDRGGWSRGYLLAIAVSAIGHAIFFYLVFFFLPGWLKATTAQSPAYTVKIVDAIPAGDLGTHLPRLSQQHKHQIAPPPDEEEAKAASPATPAPEDEDKNAIALNTTHQTPTPTPLATPQPKPSVEPTPRPEPTATATPRRKKHRATPVPTATPTATPAAKGPRHHRAKPTPVAEVTVAKVAATPGVEQKLDKVRQQLMAEHLKNLKNEEAATEPKGTNEAQGGGPAAAETASAGKGYGVGAGGGSEGIQQDAGFLLYYQQVQKKIKDAWSFAGDNPELTATVTFGINPDGSLNAIKVTESSRDPAFDDSVVRAIRRAAPFAPPPEKYRAQFWQGIEAVFKLGELNS